MLRIAVPNKGSLSLPASEMLSEAGYRQRGPGGRELVLADPANDVEFFYLRPRDIAVYVGSGTVDVGITGRDLLLDSGVEAVEHRPLGFATSTFRFAAPAGEITSLEQVNGKRVATSYDVLVGDYLAEHGVDAAVVHLDGAVESSVQLGIADVVADVVETGSTLRAAGLATFGEPILRSEAVLIRKPGEAEPSNGLTILDRRLQGVLVARQYVLMDYDVPNEHLEAAVAITPGFESPTVSPLHDGKWSAVRSMVRKDVTNKVMDELYDVGARAILVTSIHACRV
ncbi:ATP phosphoribosyltransferase [Georgenia yuyongxinii]|uniref:ATP phosphoribosyltransferase n=1 Tax=Georgenia yuyongxinii TaxID=2589797 RepID=A0A552WVL5_9MICO|nr:ATP phosphoribosyltransferase [Georgenia yuyongxinii]QDC24870.1 ATP phosphoribosyltransferase [Georgenia yuyongxinii]TRW46812.1 ATP phosphoribosyltransferase [Georgenia yuyongxinii]